MKEFVSMSVGPFFETKKATLLTEDNSFFTVMLSGRWKPNEKNEYFIDRRSMYFEYVIDFLRYHEPLDMELFTSHEVKKINCEFEFYNLPCPFPMSVLSLQANVLTRPWANNIVYNFWGLVVTIRAKNTVVIDGFDMALASTTNSVQISYVKFNVGNKFDNFKTIGWEQIHKTDFFLPRSNEFSPICKGLNIDITAGSEYSFHFHCKTSNGTDGQHSVGSAGGIMAPQTYNNDGNPYFEDQNIGIIRGVNLNGSLQYESANTNCLEMQGNIHYFVNTGR